MEVSGDYQNTLGHYSSDCLGEDIVKRIEIIFNDPRAEGRGVPEYGSVGAAGLDLRSCDNAMIYPGETVQFPMGYALYIGDHTLCGMIMPRSGLGVKGILNPVSAAWLPVLISISTGIYLLNRAK